MRVIPIAKSLWQAGLLDFVEEMKTHISAWVNRKSGETNALPADHGKFYPRDLLRRPAPHARFYAYQRPGVAPVQCLVPRAFHQLTYARSQAQARPGISYVQCRSSIR